MRKEAQKAQGKRVKGIHGYHHGELERITANSDRIVPILDDGTLKMGTWCHYGLEIETECRGIRREAVLAEVLDKVVFPNFKFGNRQFKVEHDGSLGGDTCAEIITIPMTKGRIRNDYAAYQTMFDTYFPAFGISADSNSTNCGMHVNVSNGVFGKTKAEQAEGIRKMYYVINRYYRFMCKLFHRPSNRTYWCGEMTESHIDEVEGWNCDASEYAWENACYMDPFASNVPESHNNCVNLAHVRDGRLEIRLVGGQDCYYAFRNTMECVFFLTEKINKLSWADLEDLTKIFNKCNQYVVKRLQECVGYNGFNHNMLNNIEHHMKTEDDLELHR